MANSKHKKIPTFFLASKPMFAAAVQFNLSIASLSCSASAIASVAFPLVFACNRASAQMPSVAAGRIERLEAFSSKYITARNVDVWLPPTYDGHTPHAVLYMHDGQMLFDPAHTWNGQAWEVDDAALDLMKTENMEAFVVVGIWSDSNTRYRDYFPQQPFHTLSKVEQDSLQARLKRSGRSPEPFVPQSDNYLRFLVEELKPYIDRSYLVHSDACHTALAGSSMGGLISWYALCEYPKVFGAAACVSTHWPGTSLTLNNAVPNAFYAYLLDKLPPPQHHRLYFACGDQTLDALYPPLQLKADSVLKLKGYAWPLSTTLYFKGHDHSEASWKKQMPHVLRFLFEKKE